MSAPNTSTKFAQVLQKELQDIRTRRGELPTRVTWEQILGRVNERILASEMPELVAMIQSAQDEPTLREAFVSRFILEVEKEAFARGAEKLTAEQEALRTLWDKVVRANLHDSLMKELQRIRGVLLKDAPERDEACEAQLRTTIGGVLWEVAAQATRHEALGMGLVGLAFSGGGIRSATFNLGVTQVLAELGLLPSIDYLSTVSGGGYIGGWLAAWMKRAGSVESVAEQLNPSRVEQAKGRDQPPLLPADQEPEPINHLRAYSNYLSPRSGLSSSDTWVLIAIYLRNILLNQFVLLPFIMALLLVPRFLVWFYQYFGNEKLASAEAWNTIMLVLLVSSLGISFFFIGLSVHHMGVNRRQGEASLFKIQNAIRILVVGVIVPLFIFALLITWLLSWDFSTTQGGTEWQMTLEKSLPFDFDRIRALDVAADPDQDQVSQLGHHLAWILLLGTLFSGLTVGVHLVLGILNLMSRIFASHSSNKHAFSEKLATLRHVGSYLWSLMSVTVAAFATSTLYYAVFGILFQSIYFVLDCDVAIMASFGPPLVIGIIVLGFNLAVGLRGSGLTEDVRELWASLCGWLMLYAVVWAAVVSAALFGPALLQYLGRELTGWSQAVLGATWLGTAIGGALAGQSDKTSNGNTGKLIETFTRAVPPFFVLGLLLLTSLLLSAALENWPDQADLNIYFRVMNIMDFSRILAWWLGCVAVALFMAYCVDVNIFSLHGLYANRLIRCYLGASRAKGDPLKISDRRGGAPVPGEDSIRSPNPITGFDPNDDMPLSHLRIGSDKDNPDVTELKEAQKYTGPFYLINTALNLMTGDELAWQERKAESFVLSPLFCGSPSTGFRRLPETDDNALSLGNAVTLSGAAVSPNMGYHSSPAVAALLTIFNFRLGGWVANPRHEALSGTGPRLGLLYLCKELYGRANARSSFVYLSDGGHFENLGVYELVRRRCRYIISSDVGADGDLTFEDLGGLVRKVRTDFGIRIEIDVAPIRKLPDTGFSRWHCAIGKIRYSDVDPNAEDGVIVYLKSSMTGDEPSDVLQFHSQHPEFPHTPTSDQFFNESKFESYRALGYHIAKAVLCEAVAEIKDRDRKSRSEVTALLFDNLHDHWFPPPAGTQRDFLKSTKGYIDLHHSLRTDPRLHDLTREIYGSLDAQLHDADDKPIVQLHIISQMLQLMEDVWVGLQLDANRNYPLYQGWLEAFGRWAKSPIFRRHWPTLRAEYSKDFQRFCQSLIDA